MTTPLPQPPAYPVIGNVFDLNPDDPVTGFGKLEKQYGPIYKLNVAGREIIVVNNVEIADELCDETRFSKKVAGPLQEVRNGVHDGLFTAYPEEPRWAIAHRLLMPAFGPMAISGMFDEMYDVATQLVLKWARQDDEEKIHVTDDFTRLTLDSIALCAMGTRFNSYYREKLHPFVDAMVDFLVESGARARRTGVQQYFYRNHTYKYQSDIDLMQNVSKDVVAHRRKFPNDKKDLLNAMLKGIDPKTGQGLTDDMITNNMITFLIGHETTSGLLSFLFYYMLKNPSTYLAAQREVDEVIGKGQVTVDHMSKLPYITACLRETLRLSPTAPAFTIQPKADGKEEVEICNGRYKVNRDAALLVWLPCVHRDKTVYGEDAEEFRPERMLEDNFQKLPKNAWKPFGNGMRACIGRAFAWQEALLATAMLLQYFDFRMDDPTYELKVKSTLTIKPQDFFMHAKLRAGLDPMHLEPTIFGNTDTSNTSISGLTKHVSNVDKSSLRPMKIFYGSNTGTCQAFAQTLASNAIRHGYAAETLPLDHGVRKIPTNQPVVFISASFEGEPPDNAVQFMQWTRSLKGNELAGIRYAVFGCGHSDWHATFHKIPKEIDSTLGTYGAKKLTAMGSADAAKNAMIDDFDHWEPSLWTAIADEFGDAEGAGAILTDNFKIEVSTQARPTKLQQSLKEAKVLENTIISASDAPVEMNVKLRLPEGMTYRSGDYLAILPINPQPTIRRVLKHFELPFDAVITVETGRLPGVPEGSSMALVALLAGYVELSQPATKKNIEAISKTIPNSTEASKLLALASSPAYEASILDPRVSPLDLLERYPTATLPLASFLSMLQAMRIRQYSISSSPLASATTCSITVGVLAEPSLAAPDVRFLGVASNFINSLEAGDTIHVAVRPSHQAFHLPVEAETTPVLMFAAGTGIAPFRGFIEERAALLSQGKNLAPALLYLGIRRETDIPYASSLSTWQATGAVDIRYVFSREPGKSPSGAKYVQDRMWAEREELVALFDKGAKVYICGSSKLGEGVRECVLKIAMESRKKKGETTSREKVEKWWESVRNERFAVDVFT